MTDRPANLDLATRFAALIALVNAQPSAVMEQRDAARAVAEATRSGELQFSLVDGVLLADGAPFDSPLLASRFAAYGVEELGLTDRAVQADLLELARLLAAAPGTGDQFARFAARSTAIDNKALPRRLSVRPAVEPATPASPPPNPPAQRISGATRRLTPRTQTPIALKEIPAVAAPPEARDAPERLVTALAVPETSEQGLAAARHALERADTQPSLTQALERLVVLCDLAFRQGRHDDLIEALATLVALEFELLERDSSDARRQAFNHAVRTLARPVLLRQIAVLRHSRAADPVAAERLQQVIYRFGIDGAEAMIDEFASATSDAARAVCVESLRGLRRTYDALLAFSRDPRESVVRQTAQLLGELREPPAYAILAELSAHPDPRTRRIALSAVAESGREEALQAVTFALDDESLIVRLRAVAALSGRREPEVLHRLTTLIGSESDREVLYAAIGAVGAIATPEAVQVLIPIAAGEGDNPLKRSAAMRIQACIALAIIRTPLAMAAVQTLRSDRDRDVREASVRLVAQAQRRSTTGKAAISAP